MATTTNSLFFSSLANLSNDEAKLALQGKESLEWFRHTIRSKTLHRPHSDTFNRKKSLDKHVFNSGKVKFTNTILPGIMYLFSYDPKLKEILPYYDIYPLIFPVSRTDDGFYGLNLHYLHPYLRAKLMDALYTQSNLTNVDENTRLKISYDILKSTSSLEYYKPCYKKYLYSHVKSEFIPITGDDWNVALFLPFERFKKKSKTYVWKKSGERFV